jgi:hypothetical protein
VGNAQGKERIDHGKDGLGEIEIFKSLSLSKKKPPGGS